MKDIFDYTLLPAVYPKGFLKDSIANIRRYGLPKGLYTGVKTLDDIFRLDECRLVTVTGVPGSGKSEFVDYLTTTFNRKYGKKTLYYSPENMPVGMHIEKLLRKYYCKPIHELSDDEYERGMTYLLDNFFFMNTSQYHTLTDIVSTTEAMVKKNGIEIVVIDPLNCVEFEKSGAELETQYISRLLDEVAGMARRLNLIVFIVAHPKKMEKKSDNRNGTGYEIPNAYDINGSAHFFNKSDFILVVHRENPTATNTIIKIDKVKFANYGKPGKCTIGYDEQSGNYYDIDPEAEIDGEPFIPVPFTFPNVEKVTDNDPLNVEVSMYSGATDEVGTIVNLKDFLFSDKCKKVATDIREKETPELRHDYKSDVASSIPCVTVSGVFANRRGDSIVTRTGLLCIDIDHKDNRGVMGTVPTVLRNHPSVVYASKSITGDGYFAIVKVENPEHHAEHYMALEKEFMDEYGIKLDPSCKDVGRLRFGTYDENPYYNPNATTYYKEFSGKTNAPTSTPETRPVVQPSFQLAIDDPVANLDNKIALAKLLHAKVAEDYDQWQKLAMSISTLGEEGRPRFHAVSSLAPNYDKEECDRRYSYVLEHYAGKNEYTIATAIDILNEVITAC